MRRLEFTGEETRPCEYSYGSTLTRVASLDVSLAELTLDEQRTESYLE